MDRRVFLFVSTIIMIASIASGAFAVCEISGTVTAELQTSGPFAGLYKYTSVLTWRTDQGLSNVTMDCGFGQCPEATCNQTFLFDDPAGFGDGEGGCTMEFTGEFNCQGNPSIGFIDPAIKWDAVGDCQPGKSGTVTLCFYTNLGPRADYVAPVFIIKNGGGVCRGTVTGDCPAAPCVVPTAEMTWGQVKAKFR